MVRGREGSRTSSVVVLVEIVDEPEEEDGVVDAVEKEGGARCGWAA